jgi:hypothetical protein
VARQTSKIGQKIDILALHILYTWKNGPASKLKITVVIADQL